jgi:isoleucyl-tRNA synthetase
MEKDNQLNNKSESASKEEGVLQFWADNKIFDKSLKKDSPKGEFVFYEGPPTANAKPALHHLEARAFKDVIPRYKTMRGYHVRRNGGWDTHGLPVELQIEKKLGLKNKKDIEEYGIEKFNAECKDSVFEYIKDWEDFTDRIGYWVNKKDAYFTFNTNYIESLWNVFSEVEKKNLLYKDYRIVPWCARCGTPLASHELAQGYEDVKDLSVFVKFRVSSGLEKISKSSGRLSPQPDVQNSSEPATYLLAWTTTPWTLPGNVALAVGEDIDYVKAKKDNEILIIAKSRLEVLGEDFEVIEEIKGSDLVGLSYEPLYPNAEIKNDKAYKVYTADFVTTEDGTGIVHIAPMYGADDFDLANNVGLSKIHTVGLDGKFLPGVEFLAGRFVMEKDESGKPTVAVDIIKDLTMRGLFFAKKNYEHNYPHCWRCKTPLIYYARDSWYIAMSKLRNELIAENEKINWEPSHIKEGRFGEWLREVKDWAISRERYWGTPMPIWETEDKKDRLIVGSIEELKKYSKTPITKIILVRHGQAENNVLFMSSAAHDKHPLTELGYAQAQTTAENLMKENIDVVFSSPVLRAKQTAEAYTKKSGMEMIIDERLSEIFSGSWEEKSQNDPSIKMSRDVYKALPVEDRYLTKRGETGESWEDLQNRVQDFLDEMLEKYAGKTVLCFAHQGTDEIALKILKNLSNEDAAETIFHDITNGEIMPIYVDSRTNREIDLHRPFIDGIILEKDGKSYNRVKEVLDVWFDSGAMPFAAEHYPFENKEYVNGPGYPADFISEAVDQTRGWFYTLLAVGVLMGKGTAYKNCICLGHILDDKGKKMSKSIGNIVNPWEMMDKYGVDTLRLWMYSVNQPGDSKNFDEKTVAELHGKVFTLISNCYKFYELYSDDLKEESNLKDSKNVLDKWILARLNQLIKEGTESLDNFKLFEPARALRDFVGDLSTWYIRRSRDRFKGEDEEDKQFALATTKHVFIELAKFMAPMTPFFAEDLYQKVGGEKESVHLDNWPVNEMVDEEVLSSMKITRDIVTSGLEARQKQNIKVRQPLASLVINQKLNQEFLELIKDEINVKDIKFGEEIILDTNITPELQREGDFREFLRSVQGMRKDNDLLPNDLVTLVVPESSKEIISGFEEELKKVAGIKEIKFEGSELKIEK